MKKNNLILLVMLMLVITAMSMSLLTGNAQEAASAPQITAVSAILTDNSGNNVLFGHNADEQRPIASMVKIMTLNIVFDEIEAGSLSYNEQITASENASSMGGSQAFLDAHSTYNAGELIKSVIVASANDSCVALAERISFSVEAFVARMNGKAAELGMKNTNFVNCTGLPAVNQYSTARDVSVMFARLIKFDKFFEYSGEWMYDFQHPSGRATSLTNTNKLVRFYEGCDGGKTGFTSEARSCLAATAVRGGSRFISVVMGAEDAKTRNAQVCKLFDYGFAGWEIKQPVFKGIPLEQKIAASGSREKEIAVMPAEDYTVLVKRGSKPDITITTDIGELRAPIAAGDTVGRLSVHINGELAASVNLISADDAHALGYNDILDEIIHTW